MRGEKKLISLDATIDRGLDFCVNVEPPVGMEKRILARISQERGKAHRTMRIAGLALVTILVGAAIYRPMDSARPDAITERISSARYIETVVSIASPTVDAPPVDFVEASVSNVIEPLSDEGSFLVDSDEESLISDFELEPLSVAALEVAPLSD